MTPAAAAAGGLPGASAIALVQAMEGCRLAAYQDSAGVWTIGWGYTGPEVGPGLVWTQDESDAAFLNDLELYAASVGRLVSVELTVNERAAFTSLAYNIGLAAFSGSSALHLCNMRQWSLVPAHIALWDKANVPGAGMVTVPGLYGRRSAEIALWRLPDGAPLPDFAAIRDQAAASLAGATGVAA